MQSAEKSDNASYVQALCGAAVNTLQFVKLHKRYEICSIFLDNGKRICYNEVYVISDRLFEPNIKNWSEKG